MNEILFIGTYNTNRSAIAEVFAKSFLKKRGSRVKVTSRGINVIVSSRANPNAVKVLADEYRMDLTQHLARKLAPDDVKRADLIYTVTEEHANYLKAVYPQHKHKVFLLGDAVRDPADGDYFAFQACAEDIYVRVGKICGGIDS